MTISTQPTFQQAPSQHPMSKPPAIGIVQRTRKSPFYDATVEWGAKAFTIYNHMLMPLYYDSPEADYWHLMKGVTLWDVAVERQVEITGPDALRLTQMLTPRNLSRFRIGQCKYAPIIAEDGGMINDPLILRLGEDHFWLSLADSDVLLWARGVAYGLGLNVTVREPDVSPLALQGPKADLVAAALFGDWIHDLRFFRFRELEWEGIPLVIARSGWSKQGGYELYLRDGRFGVELWNRVMTAGKPFAIAPAAPSGIERVESGLLSYGNDMTLENNPFEIGLEQYCDLEQEADFIGKAALRQIVAAGIKQKLVGLIIQGERLPGNEHHWPLLYDATLHDTTSCGHVTSATYSPRLQRNIALAMVPIAFAKAGTSLIVETPQGRRQAIVSSVPFVTEA